jgi:hypothetical protein
VSVSPQQQALIVEPEDTAVARQWLGKHLPAKKNTHATIEELLDAVCVTSNTQYVRKGKKTIYSSRNFLLLLILTLIVRGGLLINWHANH